MSFVVAPHHARDCPAIAELEMLAAAEGHEFVERTRREWLDGTNQFDRPGECFYVAVAAEQVIGMCGVNIDPYLEDALVGRLRHMYTHPGHRRQGVAEALVGECQRSATEWFTRLRLRTSNPSADALYRHLGFELVDEADATHSWLPNTPA